jgi:NADPH2:quinone reductase
VGKQGADTAIPLDQPIEQLTERFAAEAGSSGFQVVIDYLWGKPAEALMTAVTRKEFAAIKSETRYVQVGESAGAAISLPAAVLRSSPLTIMGTAGIPPGKVLFEALQNVMSHAASGELQIETERVPLTDIESAWNRNQSGRRMVVIP